MLWWWYNTHLATVLHNWMNVRINGMKSDYDTIFFSSKWIKLLIIIIWFAIFMYYRSRWRIVIRKIVTDPFPQHNSFWMDRKRGAKWNGRGWKTLNKPNEREREKKQAYMQWQWGENGDNVKTYILIIKHVIDIAISIVFTDVEDDEQRPCDIWAFARYHRRLLWYSMLTL